MYEKPDISPSLIHLGLLVVQKELPEQWNNTKKLAISVKQQVAPLQANEVANIRRKLSEFDSRQQEFREEFRKIAAFSYSCPNPYDEMDKVRSIATIADCSLSVSLFQQAQNGWQGGPCYMQLIEQILTKDEGYIL